MIRRLGISTAEETVAERIAADATDTADAFEPEV
jgi:hypothetical protein